MLMTLITVPVDTDTLVPLSDDEFFDDFDLYE